MKKTIKANSINSDYPGKAEDDRNRKIVFIATVIPFIGTAIITLKAKNYFINHQEALNGFPIQNPVLIASICGFVSFFLLIIITFYPMLVLAWLMDLITKEKH